MKIILCDDNTEETREYQKQIEKIAEEEGILIAIQEYTSGEQMIMEFESSKSFADVIFLDILMKRINGVDAAQQLRELGYDGEIIFLTKSADYVLPAFDVRAFNYVVKGDPKARRFEKIFRNVLKAAKEKQDEYITFTAAGEHLSVAIKNIQYFEMNAKIVTVTYNKNDKFEFLSTLTKLENTFMEKGFLRIHRSYLVQVDYIAQATYSQIVMVNGDVIPVGRKYQKELQVILNSRKK